MNNEKLNYKNKGQEYMPPFKTSATSDSNLTTQYSVIVTVLGGNLQNTIWLCTFLSTYLF